MRRRLWLQICVLDRQASVDRGSDPIITTSNFSTLMPLHVNDEDLSPHDVHEVQEREEFTDVSISLVCHEVFDTERRLNYVPAGESDQSQGREEESWAQRRGWVTACHRRTEEKYLRFCNVSVPRQRYASQVANIMVAIMWLCCYRPLQKRPGSLFSVHTPPPGILHLAVEVLERSSQLLRDPCSKPFRWIAAIWVQWHALAVMIAELCVQTEGPTVERAWGLVGTAFEEASWHVADSAKGRLWRPIKKLMNRAQDVRMKHLERTNVASSFSPCETFLRQTSWPNIQILESNKSAVGPETRQLMDDYGLVPQVQEYAEEVSPLPMDWDSWSATRLPDRIDYNDEMNQIAWTNWETFVDDFQAVGESTPGQDNTTPPWLGLWQE